MDIQSGYTKGLWSSSRTITNVEDIENCEVDTR